MGIPDFVAQNRHPAKKFFVSPCDGVYGFEYADFEVAPGL